MAHNYYQFPGGEEESFHAELSLLRSKGHEVITFTRSNQEIQLQGIKNRLKLAANTVWSWDSYHDIVRLIRMHKPQVAHFQNTFPLISPSVYYACKSEGIPVIQSLRNYRLMCANGFFLRDGKVCEDCMGKSIPLPGIFHACYRNSRLQTSVYASMLSYHRVLKTWESQVDYYIALTEFSRSKFVQAGLPPEKILLKPNYIPDFGDGKSHEGFVVYVGRLSAEKGINTLLHAWKKNPSIPLKIVGEGPLYESAQNFIRDHNINAELLGRLPNEQAMSIIRKSAFLIFPSLWYETFGRTLVESFSCGKPVVASRIGTATEIIQDGVTGLHFTPGDDGDLSEKVSWLWRHPSFITQMGITARNTYLKKYSLEKNYEILMNIYNLALQKHGSA